MMRTICVLSAISLSLMGNARGRRQQPTATRSPKATATSTAPATTPSAGMGTRVRVSFVRADKVATAGRNVTDPNAKEQAVHAPSGRAR